MIIFYVKLTQKYLESDAGIQTRNHQFTWLTTMQNFPGKVAL